MKISVVMICYNQEHFIEKAINGVLMQEGDFEIELIVADDASNDNTQEIIKRFASTNPNRIVPILRSSNLGMNNNFWDAYQKATGDFIAMCEGDDYWTDKQKLSKQVAFLRANEDCSMCFHNVEVVYSNNENPSIIEKRHNFHSENPVYENNIPKPKKKSTIDDLVTGNFIQTCSVLYRANLVKELPKWFFEAGVGDWLLHIFHAEWGKIGYLDEVMACYRVHQNGVWSSTGTKNKILKTIDILKQINKHFNDKYKDVIRKKTKQLFKDLANDSLHNALEFAKNKDWQKAIESIDTALEALGSSGGGRMGVFELKAKCQIEIGRFAEAQESISNEMILFPENEAAFELNDMISSMLNRDYSYQKLVEAKNNEKVEVVIEKYDVAIIIPVFNNANLTYQCINSIYGNNINTKFEVIVVDNGSNDETAELMSEFDKDYDNFTYVRNEYNLGFAKACNIGIETRKSKHILLLNNDIICTEGWLDSMLECLEKDPAVGIVGSCLIYPDSDLIQHCGVTIGTEDAKSLAPYHKHRLAKHKDTKDAITTREVTAVTGACMLISNALYEKIGGLDDIYLNGCEDIDYCFAAKTANFKVIYCADSLLYHYESMTENRHEWDIPNWTRLNKKWLGKVQFDETQEMTIKAVADIKQREMDIKFGVETMYSEITDELAQESIKAKPIDFSVIIPVRNNPDYTQKCIDTLFKTAVLFNIEVIVIDNDSDTETKELLASYGNKIKLITNAKNKSYSKANNQGAEIAKGKYFVFLNNDVETMPGWLDSLEELFESNSSVGIQGAKLLYPNDTIQHAGIVYGQLSLGLNLHYHIYLTAQSDAHHVSYSREYQMVTGALLSIRSELFNEIGGFDEGYFFGYEDLDLCLKTRKAGKQVWYNANCVAYHYESITKKSEGIDKFERWIKNPDSYDAKNHQYFMSKWGNIIQIDADKYFKEDGFFGLCKDVSTRKAFENRAMLLANKAKDLYYSDQTAKLETLSDILFGNENYEFLAKPKSLMNINDKTMKRAEDFLEISDQQTEQLESITDLQINEIENQGNPDTVNKENNYTRKILFTMFGWNEAGGGTILPKSIAKSLVKKGWEVVVVHTDKKNDFDPTPYKIVKKVEDGIQLYGIQNRPTVFLDNLNPLREIKDDKICEIFSQILDSEKPNLVHFHNFLGLSFEIATIAKSKGYKTAYTAHNYHLIDPNLYLFEEMEVWNGTDFFENSHLAKDNPEMGEEYEQRRASALDLINNQIDFTFAVSNRQKEILTNFGANANKIAVINQISELASNCNRVSQTESKALRLGFIGAAIPRKGLHNLLIASRAFQHGEIEIHVHGFIPEDYLTFIKSIPTNVRIEMHGSYSQEHIEEIASSLDLMVLPSIWEDCAPLTIAESLAMGLPVVAPKIGGFPDFVKHGFNGFLYSHNNVRELASVLVQLNQNRDVLNKVKENAYLPYKFEDYLQFVINVYDKMCSDGEILPINHNLLFMDSLNNEYAKIIENAKNAEAMNMQNETKQEYAGFSKNQAVGKMPETLPSPLKLNLGCGRDIKEGWLNLDLFSDDTSVIYADIRVLKLPDNSADFILASDVLEHFSHRETQDIIQEWARVLKPGGQIEIRCPNLRLQMQAYMRGDWNAEIASYMIFGGQTNPGDFHCIGFDEKTLAARLLKAGLKVVNYVEHDFPQDKGFINLNMTMIAEKPVLEIEPEQGGYTSFNVSLKDDKNTLPPTSNEEQDGLFKGMNFGKVEETAKIESVKIEEQIESISQPAYAQPQINIVWEGSQFVYHSLALINREHSHNIIRSGVANLTIIPYENDEFSPELNDKYKLLAQNDIRYKSETSDEVAKLPYIWIRHQWPPKQQPPQGAKWIIMQPWEFSALPKDFVEIFNNTHEVWTPSNFSRSVFVNSGVDFNKVQVIPNGIDPELFKPAGNQYPLKTNKKLKFLYVGGTIMRKGFDVLLSSYLVAFKASDDVCLVVKDMGGNSFYKGQTAQNMIASAQSNPDSPEIEYITETLSEEQIASLYRACDVFVAPYRGEGFSLPTLEAMACGLPVIVTKGGATDDFVDEEIGWQIPSERISIGTDIDGQELVEEAFLLEPNKEALIATLRDIYDNPTSLLQIGLFGSYRARTTWTWNRASMKMLSRLDYHYSTNMAAQAKKVLVDKRDDLIELVEAEYLFNDGEYEKAIEKYVNLLKTANFANRYKLYAYCSLSMAYYESEEFEKALNVLDEADKVVFGVLDTSYLRAKTLAVKGDLTAALDNITITVNNWNQQKYQCAIGLSLDHILCFMGDIFFAMGDYSGAEELYKNAITMNSESLSGLFGLALAEIELGKVALARTHLKELLSLNPSDIEARELFESLG